MGWHISMFSLLHVVLLNRSMLVAALIAAHHRFISVYTFTDLGRLVSVMFIKAHLTIDTGDGQKPYHQFAWQISQLVNLLRFVLSLAVMMKIPCAGWKPFSLWQMWKNGRTHKPPQQHINMTSVFISHPDQLNTHIILPAFASSI